MNIDETDRLIVRLLSENARMPVSELARKVGLSGPSTSERIRRLENNGIISHFTVELDLAALGYPLAGHCPDQAAAGQHAHCR